MARFSTIRAGLIFALMIAFFVTLLGRVAYLQTFGRQLTIRRAERQQHQNERLEARRGSIFDANGMLMAGTVETYTLYLDAKFMLEEYQTDGRSLVDMDEAIAKLARIVDKDPFAISKMISERPDARFVKIAENIDQTTCEQIRKLKYPGVGLAPISDRYYPMASLAAHILGGTGKDSHGLDGLELRFDKALSGKDGFCRELKDAGRRPIDVSSEDYIPPEHGYHLVLTIDANLQMIAEQELAEACTTVRAKRAELVLMDPRTGAIYAMANWPTFNPQNLDDSTNDLRRNRVLTDPYEPGSTMKPFIAGPALAAGITRPDEVFVTGGKAWHTPYGRKIEDVHAYGQLAFWDVLVKSSNIGMSMLGERMGNTRLYNSVTGFGFGKATGIELPAENAGKVHALNKWSKLSTESVAQGYEIMVTPLQLARAFSAYANGGKLVQPHLVKGILDPTGKMIDRPMKQTFDQLPQVIDPVTAGAMRRILADVPVRGTAQGKGSKVWNIFGKTGTAHISSGKGGYSESKFTSSFIAGAPFENPKLVVAFIVHEPDRSIAHYGGAVAAPNACKLLERALMYLQVPESPDLPLPPQQIIPKLWEFNPKAYVRDAKVTVAARD